jgi:6-phosphogluconolactonase (cycloisomerase 2 family)
MKRLILCAAVIILSALTSCDDLYNDAFSDSKSSVKYYGYVTTTSSLYSYEVIEDGSFSQIGTPFTGLSSAQRIAAHPSGDYIYVASNGSILCFKTEDNGSLTPLAPLVSSVNYYTMVVHPSGKYLYAIAVSASVDPKVYIYNINSDGTLSFLNTAQRPGANGANNAIVIDSSGSRLFLSGAVVGGSTTYYIWTFTIGTDGNIIPTSASAYEDFGTSIINMTIHPSKDYLYAILLSNSLHALKINSNGSFTAINSDTLILNDIKISASGKNIFTTLPGSVSRSYGVLNTGAFYKISDNTNLPGAAQKFIEVHPNGKYVYNTDTSATYKSLICYAADPGGSLSVRTLTAECSPLNPIDVKIISKTVFGESK